MNDQRGVEVHLRHHLAGQADATVLDGQLETVLAITSRTSQLGRARATATLVGRGVRPLAPTLSRGALLLAGAAILAALLGLAVVAGQRPQPAPPFNGLILFGRYEDAPGDTVVYTIHPDGTGLHRVRPEPHEAPHWSHDGRRILLGDSVASVDGTVLQTYRLGSGTFHVECSYFSPDDSLLLCEGFDDNPTTDASVHGIYAARASDGGDLRRLTALGVGGTPAGYSPDGLTILFSTLNEVTHHGAMYLVDSDGSNQRRLGALEVNDVSWAPDGRSVLAASHQRLYRVDVATGVATPITIRGQPDAALVGGVWSPDQTQILVKRLTPQIDLYVMKADGSALHQLTSDANDDRYMDWGTHLLDP